MNVLIIKEIVDNIVVLDDFLQEAKKQSAELKSNGYSVPVPPHLLKKWYAELVLYRIELMKRLMEATNVKD